MEERTVFLRPPAWLPLAVVVLAGAMYIGGKLVETRQENRVTISVMGEGRVTAVPDISELSFGVQTGREATAQAAMQTLEKHMSAIIAAVKKQGIEAKDIQTESLWLNPAFDWKDGEQIPRGYEATQSLRVKVRDLEKIGAVLSAATAAGANQVGGINFTIDDPEELRAEARAKAIENAQKKAGTLAGQLGKTLGDLRAFRRAAASLPFHSCRAAWRRGSAVVAAGGRFPSPRASRRS
jgi:hypothetical protein